MMDILFAKLYSFIMQEQKKFMREKGKKKDGQRFALPPQIFNGDDYRGNFEDFDIANEDDMLEEFLGKDRQNPKVEPVKTGAVAPVVGRLKPGKLDIKDKCSGNVSFLLTRPWVFVFNV